MGEEEDLERIRLAVASGAGVCLVGAGFARAAMDAHGHPVPSTDELTREIKLALDVDSTESVSLADIADYAAEDSERLQKLRLLLISRLTVTSPSPEQRELLNHPWRAVFTTNFDDVIEQIEVPKPFFPVTPTMDAGRLSADKVPVYYMHGRARDLLETDVDPALVISERNYLELGKRNRDLYARFFNEVFCARVLLIVGYSLRDLEIAQGLLSSSFREKTYIVCHPDDGAFARSRLAKFGTVLPLGLAGISEALKPMGQSGEENPCSFQFLEEIKVQDSDPDILSEDFVKLILTGELRSEKYLTQIRSDAPTDRFCVDRGAAIDIVLDSSDNYLRRFIVSSDFGNGKSVYLSQLAVRALERGHRVAFINTKLPEVFSDIDAALKSGQRFMFILDDVVRYREVARYIGARITNQISLVCTTRGDPDDRAYEALAADLGGAVRHIDLNVLNEDEIKQWDEILERWGYWEQRIELSSSARREFLRTACGGENRSVILSLFKNSKIADRIDRIVEFFLKDTRVHIKAFAALLIASLGQRHVSWESLVTWLDIDEDALRRDMARAEIANLFHKGRRWNAFTSAQLAEFILRYRFLANDRDVLVSVYSTIVLKTADSANDSRSGSDFHENLKELMKFRFLTRLFGGDDNAVRLVSTVYRRLSEAPRLRNNPQFWLQYAMSRMEVDDLESAESYLNSALGLARDRGKDYSPFQILDQRARLYLKKNVRRSTYNKTEMRDVVKDLSELYRDNEFERIYPFRSMPLIRDFLERHIDNVEGELRKNLTTLLEGMKASVDGVPRMPRAQKGETKVLYAALREALLILKNG